MHAPLRFEPFLRPMVWGGRRLGDFLGRHLPTANPYGESWEISDHPLHRSVVRQGPLAGQTLRDLMKRDARSLLGPATERYTVFPWLIKFLDARDWLSVQVHPDAQGVRSWLPDEGAKNEAWFVLDAQPGSRIYSGLLPGVDRARLQEALASGRVAECLHSFMPRPGDCLFLPAGTVHAVGGGVLLAEVQQTSDATFRLFDWNRVDAEGRSRPLHVEQSLACIDWQRGPIQPRNVARAKGRQRLVDCPHFVIDHVCSDRPFACGGGRLEVLIVIEGAGRLEVDGAAEAVVRGDVRLLPAAMAQARCQPKTEMRVLACTLP